MRLVLVFRVLSLLLALSALAFGAVGWWGWAVGMIVAAAVAFGIGAWGRFD